MSETNNRPNADGSLRGDSRGLPDRGAQTGVSDTYGAKISPVATNSKGQITGSTGSDAPEKCYADK